MIDERKLESTLVEIFNYVQQKIQYESVIGDHAASNFYRGYAKGLDHALSVIKEVKNT